jgi:hypothetical protein
MWEDEARRTISAIAANLCQDRPDWQSMSSIVKEVAAEVDKHKQNTFVELRGSPPRINPKAHEALIELGHLEAALATKDMAKALKHAEAALRVLQV